MVDVADVVDMAFVLYADVRAVVGVVLPLQVMQTMTHVFLVVSIVVALLLVCVVFALMVFK